MIFILSKWIASNLNLPDINWTDSNIIGNDFPLLLNSTFLDFVNTFEIVEFPTKLSNTCLDIFLTNRPYYCTPIASISDHEAVPVEAAKTTKKKNSPVE